VRTLVLLAATLALALPARAAEPTIDERLAELGRERTALEARADGRARLELLAPLQTAGLLADALSARAPIDAGHPLGELPPSRQRAYAALASVLEALADALVQPGEGAWARARDAAARAGEALGRLASTDDRPLVLQVTPSVVPPRRDPELLLVPRAVAPADEELHLPAAARSDARPVVVRYVPDIAGFPEGDGAPDAAVEIEVVGLRLAGDGPATLAIGAWRGEARLSPERLHFSVPREAFAGDRERSRLVSGLLALRRDGRIVTFQLPFLVLPDRPGSVALDQKLRWMVPESNTLLSPEIVVRAEAGETRSLRRCFDPPAGWRFDKSNRRVVIVERLGWLDDVNDQTLNAGTVEFSDGEDADKVCLLVSARPATAGARTATIGRFEATLTRERPEEHGLGSGVRALDWREPLRLPLDPAAVERKLYVRLFGEVVHELDDPALAGVPFLHIAREGDVLVLKADPAAP
jgi:hypothetical protein